MNVMIRFSIDKIILIIFVSLNKLYKTCIKKDKHLKD